MRGTFFKRQFGSSTPGQRIFDGLAGIVLPIVCFRADRWYFGSMGVFGSYQVLAYSLAGIAMAALIVWLIRPIPSGLLAGVLAGAGGFSLLTGVVLLPYTLVGLFIAVISVLGLVPFMSAFTYIRCGVRALRMAKSSSNEARATATFVLGAVLLFALPLGPFLGLRAAANSAVNEIVTGSQTESAEAARSLMRWRYVVDLDRLVWAYGEETDPRRRVRLEQAYAQITRGKHIEARLYELED